MKTYNLDEVKFFLLKEGLLDTQMFDCRGIAGDEKNLIYNKDGVQILRCYYYGYLEVFGLTEEDFEDLSQYYRRKSAYIDSECTLGDLRRSLRKIIYTARKEQENNNLDVEGLLIILENALEKRCLWDGDICNYLQEDSLKACVERSELFDID